MVARRSHNLKVMGSLPIGRIAANYSPYICASKTVDKKCRQILNKIMNLQEMSTLVVVLLVVISRLLSCYSRPHAHRLAPYLLNKWTCWGLNPGPSACEVDVIPLHHMPLETFHSALCQKELHFTLKILDKPISKQASQCQIALAMLIGIQSFIWGLKKNCGKIEAQHPYSGKNHTKSLTGNLW